MRAGLDWHSERLPIRFGESVGAISLVEPRAPASLASMSTLSRWAVEHYWPFSERFMTVHHGGGSVGYLTADDLFGRRSTMELSGRLREFRSEPSAAGLAMEAFFSDEVTHVLMHKGQSLGCTELLL